MTRVRLTARAREDLLDIWLHVEDLAVGPGVERFIQKTPALRIVADYCNSLKHAGLDRKSRSGEPVETVNTHLKIDLTPRGIATSAQLKIKVGRKKYNAYRLATDSVSAWKHFFMLNSINIDEH